MASSEEPVLSNEVPAPAQSFAITTFPKEIEAKLQALNDNSQKWLDLPDADRALLARRCRAQLATMEMDWVPDNMKCIGLEPANQDAANTISFDPFLFIATVAGRLDRIADSLEGKLKVGGENATIFMDKDLSDNDKAVYQMGEVGKSAPGVKLELWAAPEGEETDPSSAQTAGVGVVLGAGNQNFLTVVDVVELAFVHKKCVLLKHHPLRHFMTGPIGHILQPLSAAGFYAQCLDSELNGQYDALITNTFVTHVHMTGSGVTHNRVASALQQAGRDKDVLFTSELGCVSPWIVCPGTTNGGKWDQKEIENNATMLASAFKSSCSMNCLSPKVLVLPSEAVWPQRADFLKTLRDQLAQMPQPPPYYPGAHKRFAAFAEEYPDGEHIQAPPSQKPGEGLTTSEYSKLGQDLTPLASLLVDVGTIGDKECRMYALQNEAFAPVLAIATVACEKPEDFAMAAAEAANKHIFGTLSCNVIYPDERDETLNKMLLALNYGCVSVNCWAAMLYSNSLGVWGGAPGSYSPSSPNSGNGFVGNAARIPRPLKSVGISPFNNKKVVFGGPMPYLLADALTIYVAGKSHAGMRVLGLLFRRGFGLLPKPMPGGRCM